MLKIKISKENKTGTVEYDQEQKAVLVTFPDDKDRSRIESYLITKRLYRIPQSDKIDDYKEIEAFPYENEMYFNLAMCTLFSKIGIYVNWEE